MLLIKTLLFTLTVPGSVTVAVPLLLVRAGAGLLPYDSGGLGSSL